MNLQQLLKETESLEATQSDIEQIENELFYLADSVTLYNGCLLSFAERKAILLEILQGLKEPQAQTITVDKSNFCLPSTKEAADSVMALAGVGGGDIGKSIDMEIKAIMSLQGILN